MTFAPVPARYFFPAALAALLLGGLWTWLSALDPDAAPSGKIAAPQTGFISPEFTLPSLAGESYRLADLRGRPILINLWASWCGPCRAEMPAMQAIYDRYKDQGFIVLAVNMTAQDSAEAAAAFASRYGLTFPILLDEDGTVGEAYQIRALPSSYFVGPDGVIQEVVIGGPMAEALLATRVENLLRLGDR